MRRTWPTLTSTRPFPASTLASTPALALALAAVLASTWLAAGLARPPAAGAQGVPPPSVEPANVGQLLTVRGEGQASSPPDVAHVELGVQTEAPTAREAVERNAAAMAAVVDAILRAGVEEKNVRTTGFTLTPVRAERRPEQPQPPPVVAYRVANGVTVLVDPVARTGEVIDAGVGAGANVSGGIRFAVRDDADLQRRALDVAVRSAKAKAEAMAAAAGVRITGIRFMTEDAGGAVPVSREMSAPASADGAATPIQAGLLTLTKRVTLVFTYA